MKLVSLLSNAIRREMHNRLRLIHVSVAAVFAMSACTGGAGTARAAGAEHTDSAGIEIVLNSVVAGAVPVFATLDSVPGLRIGTIDGRAEEQFGAVSDVLPLADGRVAVLDGLAAEIRIFDSDGAHLMTLGSKGQGPGEFQYPIKLALLPGDTLAVYDAGPKRITHYGPDGAIGRITTLRGARARIVAASFLPDGRVVGQSIWLAPGGATIPGPEPTFVRDTAVLTLFTTDGEVDDTVDVVAGSESIISIQRSERSFSVFKRSPAFGRTNVFSTHSDGIWSSANDRFELRLREVESGHLTRIVRAPGLERPATEALAQAVRGRAIAEAETVDDRRLTEAWYALSPRPETQPAYDIVMVDYSAHLWVREWSALGPATRWWVFAGGGDLLGSVDVPSGMTITSVRCGWVWGVEQDDLDVNYVVRYALRGADAC